MWRSNEIINLFAMRNFLRIGHINYKSTRQLMKYLSQIDVILGFQVKQQIYYLATNSLAYLRANVRGQLGVRQCMFLSHAESVNGTCSYSNVSPINYRYITSRFPVKVSQPILLQSHNCVFPAFYSLYFSRVMSGDFS